ncbi:MAG: hypothetical protein HY700_19775, partial [Gemmatimonadetes bacterium]|nr:hypothetical protein [Gemmatimonadota bacterium]
MTHSTRTAAVSLLVLPLMLPRMTTAQNRSYAPEVGSSNVHVLSHVPLGWKFTIADIEIEQELSRPYVYVQRDFGPAGFDIISVKDPGRAKVIYSWTVDRPDLHTGRGGSDGHYFKHQGRYYYVQSFHFSQTGPDTEVGAIVFDVTGLPDTTAVREVGRITAPEAPGGFHTLFPYRHSDGRTILFTTTRGGANVYDMARFLARDPSQGLIGKVPGLDVNGRSGGYHDYYVAYDPASRTDKFYGAGGTYLTVYDVSRPEEPRLLTSIFDPKLSLSHTFQATPDGRYGVSQTEFEPSPVRIWDLKPNRDSLPKTISRPVGAWQGSRNLGSHNHEIRWPYVFVGSFEDGLQIFNMMDPTNPYTVGFYNTRSGSDFSGVDLRTGLKAGDPARELETRPGNIFNGAWG